MNNFAVLDNTRATSFVLQRQGLVLSLNDLVIESTEYLNRYEFIGIPDLTRDIFL